MTIRILHGDSREVLKTLPEDSVDAVVTDPPYHLTSTVKRFGKADSAPVKSNGVYARASRGFMGKEWDGGDIAFDPSFWAEVERVLKPGGHLLAFGAPKNFGFMQVAIAEAGFEIRDVFAWVFGSGFPKSHDVSKAIDKAEGVAFSSRPASGVGFMGPDGPGGYNPTINRLERTGETTDAARQWEGWGTALKPAYESIIAGQKPWTVEALSGILAQKLMEALCQLPSLASTAVKNSQLSQSVFGVDGSASAQWSAVLPCNTPAALFALMDTWPSELAIPSSLNIVLSWLLILSGLSKHTSTFTTETRTSLITDLIILNSLLSENTPDIIIQVATSQPGIGLNASLVERIFSAAALRLDITQELSARGSVTSPGVLGDLRPNLQPILMCRKPLSEPTIAANVLRWGTGAINVDGCRVATNENLNGGCHSPNALPRAMAPGGASRNATAGKYVQPLGRWPANLATDGSEEVLEAFPNSTSTRSERTSTPGGIYGGGAGLPGHTGVYGFGDSGSAARFFFSAKADADDRLGSKHPTVKPVDLMRWLVRMVTPPGGTILDPFAGSGTTGEAAFYEGFHAILIEREAEYVADIERRMALLMSGPAERKRESVKARGLPEDHGPLFGAGAAE